MLKIFANHTSVKISLIDIPPLIGIAFKQHDHTNQIRNMFYSNNFLKKIHRGSICFKLK